MLSATGYMYPNPSTGIVYFSVEKESADELKIYNSVGKEVLSIDIKDINFIVNMSGMKNGLYIYKIKKSDSEVATGKLVLMK